MSPDRQAAARASAAVAARRAGKRAAQRRPREEGAEAPAGLFVRPGGGLRMGRVALAVAAGYAVVHAVTCAALPSAPDGGKPGPAPAPTTTAAAAAPFSGEAAYRLLRELVKLQRYYDAPERQRAIDFIAGAIDEHADQVTLQRFESLERASGKRYPMVNIIARQNPSARARILVGSHWDSRLWAEEDPDPKRHDQPIEGANDGGSGVAVLLELARHTRSFTRVGVDYVFFDGEEFGRPASQDYCQGSRHFAKEIAATYPEERPRAVIVLDMVGDRDQDFYQEVSSLQKAPALVREVWDAAGALGLPGWHPSAQHHITDDHSPFQELGIPAMLLIDYDYPHWHTHADTLDKVSARSLGAVGAVIHRVLAERERKGGGG